MYLERKQTHMTSLNTHLKNVLVKSTSFLYKHTYFNGMVNKFNKTCFKFKTFTFQGTNFHIYLTIIMQLYILYRTISDESVTYHSDC